MNTEDFLKQIDNENTKRIMYRFRRRNSQSQLRFSRWNYLRPDRGSLEALKQLSRKYRLIIYTCKANPIRPLINGKTGEELIWDWLDKHGVKQNVASVTYTNQTRLLTLMTKRLDLWIGNRPYKI